MRRAPPPPPPEPGRHWVWYGPVSGLAAAMDAAWDQGYRDLDWTLTGDVEPVTGEPRLIAYGTQPDPDEEWDEGEPDDEEEPDGATQA